MIDTDVTVRPARVLDVPALTAMWARMMDELKLPGGEADEYGMTAFFFNQTVRLGDRSLTQRHFAHVAEAAGKPIGFISGGLAEGGDGMVVEQLFVTPSHRNWGAARALLKAAREWGVAKGQRRVWVLAAPKRIRFYERFGFAAVNTRMVAPLDDAEMMTLLGKEENNG